MTDTQDGVYMDARVTFLGITVPYHAMKVVKTISVIMYLGNV